MKLVLIRSIACFAVLCLVLCLVAETSAAPTFFSAFDAGVGPGGLRPNSDAKAAEFDISASSLGALNLLDLESTPATSATTVAPAPGVTMNFTNHTTSFNTILDGDFDAANGFNTTVGGRTWALIFPSNALMSTSLEFVFDTPVQAWGMYHTGAGSVPADVSVQFNDGNTQSFSLSGSSGGGVGFFGFTDVGASIVAVSIVVDPNPTSGDAVGVDDIRYVSSGAVPEPTTLAIWSALGGLGMMLAARRRRRTA